MSKLPRCYANTDREALLSEGAKAGAVTFADRLKYNHDVFHYSTNTLTFANASPMGIHTWLFLPYLRQQASDEQAAYWVPLAESGKILGCYCQTELGHGTEVSAIETTATFDEETDEFVVHSPALASTKFWPGALGYAANYAIVFARLIVRGKDLGIHSFMVQIRALEDHRPLEGVELGDVG